MADPAVIVRTESKGSARWIVLDRPEIRNALGIDGQFDHPRYKAAAKALVRACERNGKAAGFLAGDVKTGRQYLDWGFRILCYGTDTNVFQGALKAGIEGLRSSKR